jgi:hypothetical protein
VGWSEGGSWGWTEEDHGRKGPDRPGLWKLLAWGQVMPGRLPGHHGDGLGPGSFDSFPWGWDGELEAG